MPRPKGVLFDLGGVLITSPLKAIQEYEAEHHIPLGYLNYAMSPPPSPLGLSLPRAPLYDETNVRSTASPNTWAELETGQLRPNKQFYERWAQDLSSLKAWREYHRIKGLEIKQGPPRVDAEILLRRMIIPEEGGKLIVETLTALKNLKKKENGIITCGLTNNFVLSLFLFPFVKISLLSGFELWILVYGRSSRRILHIYH